MDGADIDFASAYRSLVPDADRDLVNARKLNFTALQKQITEPKRVLDLCRIALQGGEHRSGVAEWFSKTIKRKDPQFSLEHDKAEAARIASLLLRSRMTANDDFVALAVLVASRDGQRDFVDDALLLAARQQLVRTAERARRIVLNIPTPPLPRDLNSQLAGVASGDPNKIRSAIAAVDADLGRMMGFGGQLVSALATQQVTVARLAEELDMLWWHIGGWSELLSRPWSDLAHTTLPLVAGFDLGDLARTVAGPAGIEGILFRLLADDAHAEVDLVAAVSQIDKPTAGHLLNGLEIEFPDLLPVHTAVRLATVDPPNLASNFADSTGINDVSLGRWRMAVHSYRERALMRTL